MAPINSRDLIIFGGKEEDSGLTGIGLKLDTYRMTFEKIFDSLEDKKFQGFSNQCIQVEPGLVVGLVTDENYVQHIVSYR